MLETADTYNPYTDTRKCGILVTFEMIDIDAAETTTPSVSDECEMSKVHQTHNRVENMAKKYAMLEKDYWALDGTFELPQKKTVPYEQTGWWSNEISNSSGRFTTIPRITFSWVANQSSVGFTLFFDDAANQYPTLMRLTAYDESNNVLMTEIINNNSVKCEVATPIENYRRLVFDILSTSEPFRRVRLTEVVFGIVQKFNNANVVSANVDYSFSPISDSLPTSEFTLTVDNADASWNMANPKGIYAYLQQTQPLDVYFTINDESVFMGRYYFAKASAEDNSMTAKITAYDKVYWLDSLKFRGGADGTWMLGQAVSTVITSSGLDLGFIMSDELSTREIMRSLPKDCSCRDAICHLATAACCSVYVDRYSNLVFVDTLADAPLIDVLNYDNMESMPKITVGEKINAVDLTVTNEYVDGSEVIYSVVDGSGDEIPQVAEYSSPTAADGYTTAAWLLEMLQHRLTYDITERGNPAREIGDMVEVFDAYGGKRNAIITKQNFSFDGGLSCDTEAWC